MRFFAGDGYERDGAVPSTSALNLNIHKRRSMTWAERLKRVFNIEVSTCVHCGGTLRIVASIEEPIAIRAILAHFVKHGALEIARIAPHDRCARAPPRNARRSARGKRARRHVRGCAFDPWPPSTLHCVDRIDP